MGHLSFLWSKRGALFGYRSNRYKRFAFCFFAEHHRTVYQGKQRVVFTHTYVFACVVARTALTHDNVARFADLTAKELHSEAFAFRFAAVLRTTDTFFVCHCLFPDLNVIILLSFWERPVF